MSSFKNAEKAHRRTHKERGQVTSRRKYGLLEKHKDYVLRARDYNAKQTKLRNLQQKARDRNPDEFYFKMTSTRLKDGRHFKPNEDKALTGEELKLLKTQDMSYINMKRKQEEKKIEALQSEMAVTLGQSVKRQHIVFVDSDEEGEEFDAVKYFNTTPELVGNPSNRLTVDQLRKQKPPPVNKRKQRRDERHRRAKCHELEQRMERKKELDLMLQKMQTQKNLLEKGARRPIKDKDGKIVCYKWKYQRKR